MEMEEKFVENDFFKNFGQKWKVRNGTDFYFFKLKKKRFLSSDGFFKRDLTMAVFRSRGAVPVVRNVLMMLVMVGTRMSRFS